MLEQMRLMAEQLVYDGTHRDADIPLAGVVLEEEVHDCLFCLFWERFIDEVS